MSLLTSTQAAAIRADLGLLLAHTYTRTPVTQGAEDDWGDAADTAGTAATAQPCLYRAVQRLRVDDAGRVTVEVPTLRVSVTDVLAVGDRVSNICDQAGTVLIAGPLVVESIEPVAGLGALLQRRATLRGAQVAE